MVEEKTSELFERVKSNLPGVSISDIRFEGCEIVLYTKDKDLFASDANEIKELVSKLKKRIILRPDPSICIDMEDASKIIKKLVPEEAGLKDIDYEPEFGTVTIEAEKPGLVIGKGGEILKEIKKQTLWLPIVKRAPVIPSDVVKVLRDLIHKESGFRKEFLDKVGKHIHSGWKPTDWVRLTALGGFREVGRSAILLQTPESKVLLDCGIKPGTNEYPYLNVPEFDINKLNAVIVSHAHLDHVGMVPYLYKIGYEGPLYMSVDYKEPVLIKEDGEIRKLTIGKFIDKTIETSKEKESLPQIYDYTAATPDKKIEAVAFSNSDFKLGFKTINKVIRHKICNGDKLYKIKTKTGRSISVTGSHSVFILREGEIKEAKVSKLKNGDYLVVPQKLPTTTIDSINLKSILNDFKTDDKYVYAKQGHKIPIKLIVSSELMRILGYFTAEGNFDKRSLQFSFGLKEISYVKQLKEDLEKVFGIKPKIRISNGNVLRVNINSRILRELFFRFFFKDCTKATTKRVPTIIFNASDELKLQFLKAYFNGDGTLNYHNKTAVAMSVSKNLVSDLTYICSQIGFNYHIHEGYMAKSAKTKNKVYQLIINLKDFFEEKRICIAKSNLIPLKESLFNREWYYHRLRTKMHISKERLLSLLETNLIKYKDSVQIKDMLFKLADSELAFLPIVEIKQIKPTNGYVYDISVDGYQNFVAGETPICLHNTTPTRDLMVLLCMDYVELTQREGSIPPYSTKEIKEAVKHTICLDYDQVSDITPDMRLTLLNSGHVLGGALVHIHIANGMHNVLYTSDYKFDKTALFEPTSNNFQRAETVITESTYGASEDIMPKRQEAEAQLIDVCKRTVERGGIALVPSFAVERSQDVMVILSRAGFNHPIYIDGMVWDATAIHTAYPEYFNRDLQKLILQQGENPFTNPIFKRIGSEEERRKVLESKEPCVIIATSGMLVGGPSVWWLKNLAENKNNSLVFVSYQAEGSLGRRIQKGWKEIPMEQNGRTMAIPINLEIANINGLSGHSDHKQLLNYISRLKQAPERIIVDHGENSKCVEFARTCHNIFRCETMAPKLLETIRLK